MLLLWQSSLQYRSAAVVTGTVEATAPAATASAAGSPVSTGTAAATAPSATAAASGTLVVTGTVEATAPAATAAAAGTPVVTGQAAAVAPAATAAAAGGIGGVSGSITAQAPAAAAAAAGTPVITGSASAVALSATAAAAGGVAPVVGIVAATSPAASALLSGTVGDVVGSAIATAPSATASAAGSPIAVGQITAQAPAATAVAKSVLYSIAYEVEQYLLSITTVTDLVGARIYFNAPRQSAALPYIVLTEFSGASYSDLTGRSVGAGTTRIQIDAYGATKAQAKQLAEAIRLSPLQGLRGAIGTQFVHSVICPGNSRIGVDQPQDASDVRRWWMSRDYLLTHKVAT